MKTESRDDESGVFFLIPFIAILMLLVLPLVFVGLAQIFGAK